MLARAHAPTPPPRAPPVSSAPPPPSPEPYSSVEPAARLGPPLRPPPNSVRPPSSPPPHLLAPIQRLIPRLNLAQSLGAVAGAWAVAVAAVGLCLFRARPGRERHRRQGKAYERVGLAERDEREKGGGDEQQEAAAAEEEEEVVVAAAAATEADGGGGGGGGGGGRGGDDDDEEEDEQEEAEECAQSEFIPWVKVRRQPHGSKASSDDWDEVATRAARDRAQAKQGLLAFYRTFAPETDVDIEKVLDSFKGDYSMALVHPPLPSEL